MFSKALRIPTFVNTVIASRRRIEVGVPVYSCEQAEILMDVIDEALEVGSWLNPGDPRQRIVFICSHMATVN